MEKDFNLIGSDGWAYAEYGRLGIGPVIMGGHWLYNYVNHLVYRILPGEEHLYLNMSLLNICLSLLLPVALIPISRIFKMDQPEYDKYFKYLILFFLFWPTAIILSTQNLKDTLLALMFCSYLSLCYLSLHAKTLTRSIIYILLIMGLLYLIFVLRSYLAVFMVAGAMGLSVLVKKKAFYLPFFLGGIVALFFSPIGEYVMDFVSYENNWLINPDALLHKNIERAAEGLPPATINMGFRNIFIDFIRLPLMPFPGINTTNIYEYLLMLKTTLVCIFSWFFIWKFIQWDSKYKWFLGLNAILPWGFYSIWRGLSGARQTFASMDILFLLMLSYFLATNQNRGLLTRSYIFGIAGLIAMFVYTSRGWLV
ncbi:MAG: hypothetical protein ACE5DO_07360 [Desulfobacterales bacterium]